MVETLFLYDSQTGDCDKQPERPVMLFERVRSFQAVYVCRELIQQLSIPLIWVVHRLSEELFPSPSVCVCVCLHLRPISVLICWISEGLNQA